MSTNIRVERICTHCGNQFTAKTTVTKYCSHKCNSAHYKLKLKTKKVESSDLETFKVAIRPFEELTAKEYLTVREASRLLNCSTKTIYRLIENDTIRAVNLADRLTRIRKNELDKILS